MHYHIDTIPIWDAYKNGSECPLCDIRKHLELKFLDFFIGDSVMEPENRIRTNKEGFCTTHFSMLYENEKKLPLALTAHTRLRYITQQLEPEIQALRAEAGKNETDAAIKKLVKKLDSINSGCALCYDIDKHMKRYMQTIIRMWKKEKEFRIQMESSKGLCLGHFKNMLETATKELSGKSYTEFVKLLAMLESAALLRLDEEIEYFTKKFDYRNADKPWGNSRDSLIRLLGKFK